MLVDASKEIWIMDQDVEVTSTDIESINLCKMGEENLQWTTCQSKANTAKITLAEANKQLKRVDKITEDVEQVTTNISSMVAVFTASVGAPLTKVAGILQGALKVFGKRR